AARSEAGHRIVAVSRRGAEALRGDVPPGPDGHHDHRRHRALRGTQRDREAVQASVTLAEEVGMNRFDPEYYALQLGNSVLGGGFYATRLYHDLRQVAGLVYTVDDEFAAGK